MRENLRGLRIALGSWGSAYLLPWARTSVDRFLLLGEGVAHKVRAFFSGLVRFVRSEIWSLLRISVFVCALAAVVVTLAYDPRLAGAKQVGSWHLTCHDAFPDIACTARGPRDEADTCRLDVSVLQAVDPEARAGAVRRVREVATVPVEIFSSLTMPERASVSLGHGLVVDEGPRVDELIRFTNAHLAGAVPRTGAYLRSNTSALRVFLDALESSRACSATVRYPASLWYRFFHLERGRSNYLIAVVKGVILTVVLLVGAVITVGLVSVFILAGSMVLVPIAAVAFAAVDLIGAFARLVRILVPWMRIYRTRLAACPWPEGTDDPLVMMQISDLHVSATALVEAETRGITDIPSASDVEGRLARLLEHCRAQGAPLLVTGDVTDRGTSAEWQVARRVIERELPETTPCWAILGNHDLNIGRVLAPARSRAAREERRQEGIRVLQGLAWHTPEHFPYLDRRDGHALILLDSNVYAARQILSNAIGELGRAQIAALRALLVDVGDVIVATHHHVALHHEERATREGPFLVALDGLAVLDVLARHAAKGHAVLFVHGHKHQESLGTFTKHGGIVTVYEHPSSTRAHPPRRGTSGRVAHIHHRRGAFTVLRAEVPFDNEP